MNTDATENKTNSQMTTNAAMITLFRAIATFRLVRGTGVSSRFRDDAK